MNQNKIGTVNAKITIADTNSFNLESVFILSPQFSELKKR
jgi:hypothetical protein